MESPYARLHVCDAVYGPKLVHIETAPHPRGLPWEYRLFKMLFNGMLLQIEVSMVGRHRKPLQTVAYLKPDSDSDEDGVQYSDDDDDDDYDDDDSDSDSDDDVDVDDGDDDDSESDDDDDDEDDGEEEQKEVEED